MLGWLIPAAVALAVLTMIAGRFPWRGALAWVPRFFLARVPLIVLVGLVAGPFVLTGPMRELFGNLFQLNGWWQLALIQVYAFMLAWQCLHQLRLFFEYGATRAALVRIPLPRWLRGVHPEGIERGRTRPPELLRYGFLPPWILTLTLTWVLARNWQSDTAGLALGLAAGLAVELAFVVLVVRIAIRSQRSAERGLLVRLGEWAQKHRQFLRPGYTLNGRLLPGHFNMSAVFLVSGILYAALGYAGQPSLGFVQHLPALAFPISLAMVLSSILGAMSFFFDGYRVPFLLVLFILFSFNHSVQDTDHYFDISHPAEMTVRAPAREAFFERHDVGGRSPVIAVCAAGGGIQSASWTARTLEGLSRKFGPEFVSSIAVVSGVSGGSVGLAYFIEELLASDTPTFAGAREAAESSVLATVAWGLSYPDFLRSMLPFAASIFPLDRGVALDRAWAQQANRHIAEGPTPMWSRWVEGAASGRLPAAILNTTVMETGERHVFSSVSLGDDSLARDFHASCSEPLDVQVFSAARLSATFPWVSPAARARSDSECVHEWHLVDGGYFDNFGVASIIEWMRTVVLEAPGKEPLRVFVLLVNGFPESAEAEDDAADSLAASSYGPLMAMLETRTTSQLTRNRVALELFKHAWRDVVDLEIIEIRPRPLEKGAVPYSLSWHLTDRQVAQNGERWDDWENWSEGPMAALAAEFDD